MPIPTAPTLMLAIGGVMLIVSWWVRATRWFEAAWLLGVAATAWLVAAGNNSGLAVWSSDPLGTAGQSLAMVIGTLFGIGSFGVQSPEDRTGERFGFLSFQIAGLMLVASSNDAVTMALSIEVVQLASLALRKIDPLRRGRDRSDQSMRLPMAIQNESCLWAGAIASVCLWLGIALVSQVTASTNYDQIGLVLSDAYHPGLNRAAIGTGSKLGLLGIGLMVAGLGTRIGLVPWHDGLNQISRGVDYWTAGCTLLAGQLAGFLALSRLCGTVWIGYRNELIVLLMVLSGLTFVAAGSLSLLGMMPGEGRIKRWLVLLPMLQGAWLTLGLTATVADLAASEQSLAAVAGQPSALALLLFAMGASFIALTGLFLVLSFLSRDNRKVEFVDELLGLGQLAPASATILAILLASLVGQPPLWGFWGYWLLTVASFNVRSAGVRAAVSSHLGIVFLVLVGVLATLLTAGVAMRFARIAFLDAPVSRATPQGRRASLVAAGLCALAIVFAGVAPARLLSALTAIRGPGTISPPDSPAGSNRGQPTASR